MQRLIITMVLIVFISLPGPALAQYSETRGGYVGPVETTAALDAKEMRDDAPVILKGRIESYLGDGKYIFSDASGSLILEIDDDFDWAGQTVGPEDVVIVYGEIERDFKEFKVEANKITKAGGHVNN